MSQTAAAPSGAAGPGGAARQKVIISVVGGTIRVDPQSFVISKEHQQEVIWEATDPNLYFTVEFENGSPFYESQFNNQFNASGLARRSVLGDQRRRYKYWVSVDGVQDRLDPDGVVTR
jgi:hypothetical protein